MIRRALIVAVAALLVIACMAILKTAPAGLDKGITDKLQTHTASVEAEKQQDALRTTPLHTATKENKATDVARLLIDGADVNACDENGKTAIHYAAENGNTGMAKLLLSRSADVNIRSAEDLTPLHCATGYGHIEMVKFLLDYGADINAVSSKSGHSALFMARYKGYTHIARLLRAKGAVIDSIDTAVILGDFMETQRMLQKDISLARSIDKANATPLHFAAYGGYKDIADLLLACGADINAKDALGRTPLHSATRKQKTEVVVFLASKGANVDSEDNKKRTPLLEAVSTGNVVLAAQLLASGANPNVKNDDESTPLHTAASTGYNEIVDILLDKGADANIRQKDGCTPLHLAVIGNQKDTAKLLLARGANPNIKDNEGNTPLIAAATLKRADLTQALLAGGAKIETVHDAALVGDIKRLHQLLKADHSLANAKNKSGLTPIYYACRFGQTRAAILLLACGADVNIVSPEYNTPIHEAALSGNRQMVKLLLAKGAKLTIHDAALIGDITAIKNMLHAGANINAADKEGKTPLSLAVKQNNIQMVKFLVARGGKDKPGAAPVKIAKTTDHKQVATLLRVYAGFTNAPVISEQ